MFSTKKLIVLLFLLVCSHAAIAQNTSFLYKNQNATIEIRVRDLLQRMTLTEKIAQLSEASTDGLKETNGAQLNNVTLDKLKNGVGTIDAFLLSATEFATTVHKTQDFLIHHTRLGIPALPITEGLHGWANDGATIFPQAIGMASSFDPGLIEEVGNAIREEILPAGVRQAFFPNLDLARDPRWGRVEETFGEDPFLVSTLGVAMINGFQYGKEKGPLMVNTAKHFFGHNSPQGGLNIASTAGGNYDLFNTHLKSFEAAVKKAGVLSIMSSYNTYNGIPTNANKHILTDILRNRWNFQGYVYSDWGTLPMMHYLHQYAPDYATAGKIAIQSGVDLEAPSPECYKYLDSLVKIKEVSIASIDSAVTHILRVKFRLGLFENPYPDSITLKKQLHSKEHVALSQKVAEQSIILMKNESHFLPLKLNDVHSIAVIGPNAAQVQFGDYSWTRDNKFGTTLLDGLQQSLPSNIKVQYAKGCDIISQDTSGFAQAVAVAEKSDVVFVAIGTASASLARDYGAVTCGEGYDVNDITPSGVQSILVKRLYATGKPVVLVLITGRALAITDIQEEAKAILCAWYPGEKGGNAITDILLGNINPSGKLPVSFPRSTGHIPAFYNYLNGDKGFYHQPGTLSKAGRDYVFSSPASLYPFGFGLSYTSFALSDLQLNHSQFAKNDTVSVSVNVENTGTMDGAEVVQLYIQRKYAPVLAPIKELKAFQKIFLKTGTRQKITLKIPIQELALYNNEEEIVPFTGNYEIKIGNSSTNLPLKAQFKVQ